VDYWLIIENAFRVKLLKMKYLLKILIYSYLKFQNVNNSY